MTLAWWPFFFSWCTLCVWLMTLQIAFKWFKAFLAVCIEIFFPPFLIYRTASFMSWKTSLCLKHILAGRLCWIQTPQPEKELLPVSSSLTDAIARKGHHDFSRNTRTRETRILKLTSTVFRWPLGEAVRFYRKRKHHQKLPPTTAKAHYQQQQVTAQNRKTNIAPVCTHLKLLNNTTSKYTS